MFINLFQNKINIQTKIICWNTNIVDKTISQKKAGQNKTMPTQISQKKTISCPKFKDKKRIGEKKKTKKKTDHKNISDNLFVGQII